MFTRITFAATAMIFITSPAYAHTSKCKFQAVPTASCKLTLKSSSGGWTKEYLEEPNGTLRIISREIRGNAV